MEAGERAEKASPLETCLDTKIPPQEAAFQESLLPLDFEYIPETVTSLKECAEHQIRSLLDKDPETLTLDEEDALDDGFVLCDLAVIRAKLQVWRRLFPTIKPFYALKCNPDPMVAAILGQSQAAGFDCASVPEIHLALKSSSNDDIKPQLCIYAHPQRAEMDLDTALQLRVQALTFDGPEELYKVHRAVQKRQDDDTSCAPPVPCMILRILVPDEHSTVPLGEKFGASLDVIPSLVHLALDLNLPIVGVSFHCGSGNRDPTAYRTAIQLATQAMATVDDIQVAAGLEPCWILDIGGGYPGRDGSGGDVGRFVGRQAILEPVKSDTDNADKETETADDIAQVVMPLLKELYPAPAKVHFISEPGRYFVEGAFALCSRIYRIRVERDQLGIPVRRHYYIAQGVQGLFKDCVLCGETFVPIPLVMNEGTRSSNRSSTDTFPSTVHGPSGEEYDVICQDYPLPVLETGDWLVFDRMGAYTLSIAARNDRPPVRYVMGGSRLL